MYEGIESRGGGICGASEGEVEGDSCVYLGLQLICVVVLGAGDF
jgi:hypothetical protein